ncbi:PLD nuclease N-terminal domain-containing protein [Seleniivibrio sp.]|uniref:PLD nuclease N-terminal domain-containing protein n=1 Tax=Seleniivibrio sp. TaxID=2898801 RepID=UPI0025E7B698|nr:PLD nuclease N-terminal domain-containing protein [Seleniivibrio sp.]MCD8553856.1 PLD nuclease N-terminal domain-containing protein [Seleniivibrio sp.]
MIGFGLVTLAFMIFGLAAAVLFIWTIVDIIRSDFKDGATKIVWIIAVIAFNFLAIIIYLIFGKETKVKPQKQSNPMVD